MRLFTRTRSASQPAHPEEAPESAASSAATELAEVQEPEILDPEPDDEPVADSIEPDLQLDPLATAEPQLLAEAVNAMDPGDQPPLQSIGDAVSEELSPEPAASAPRLLPPPAPPVPPSSPSGTMTSGDTSLAALKARLSAATLSLRHALADAAEERARAEESAAPVAAAPASQFHGPAAAVTPVAPAAPRIPEEAPTAREGDATARPSFLGKPRVGKYDFLLAQRFITHKQLENALAEAKQRGISPELVLMDRHGVRKADISTSLMLFYRHPFVALEKSFAPPMEVLAKLNLARLKAACWLPIRLQDSVVTVLVDDPNDLRKVDAIEVALAGYRVQLVVGIRDNILEAIAALLGIETGDAKPGVAGILNDAKEEPAEATEVAQRDEELHRAEVSKQDSVTVRLANQIIIDAHKARASDIHIEPAGPRRDLSIRFRVDGSCITYQQIPASLRHALVARFKIMSGLDIAERRKPQDGKIRIRLGEQEVELRVATVPTVGGNEDIVLRILAAQGALAITDIGLTPRNLKELSAAAAKPYGLILCVGPTGSGKTTTLHATLGHINTVERKIWTAEDPVEITQPGLRQVQVRPQIGYTFATAMRAFLRADPDVIMVGEMRDHETAAIAVEASLTGHLVLSTLHTNSAVETVVRMLDLGLDAFNFADALVAVVAQRLVKRICKDCRQTHAATAAELAELAEPFGGPEALAALGHAVGPDLQLASGKGCESCNGTGFRGRVAIHEVLTATDPIKQLIQGKARVPELLAQSRADGMTTLVQDGVLKVLQDVTTFGQVRAVAIR